MHNGRASSILLALLLLAPLVGSFSTSAMVVHSLESFDLTPADILSSEGWSFINEEGWSGDDAKFTSAMSADGKISFTHSRPLNLQASTFWAQDNSSEYGDGAVGFPDGYYSWTLGPEIVVNTFDVSTVSNTQIQSVELVVSFNIPDSLTQDSVGFSIDVDGHNELVNTWAHTQSGVERMSDPYWSADVNDSFEWDWPSIANAEVTLDYVSVGGTDDSQLQVDAVGFRVVHKKAAWGVETSSASFSLSGIDMPLIDLNLTAGEWQDLSLTSCGIEAIDSAGTWISAVSQRPEGQYWGRLSHQGNWSGSLEVRISPDGVVWDQAWQATQFSSLLPDSKYLQVRAMVDSGCLSRVRLDINDPTLEMEVVVHGDAGSVLSNQSLVQITISDQLAVRMYLNEVGITSHVVSVGDILPAEGDDLKLVIATAFAWNDGGDAQDLVVEITSLSIDGGYSIEWDLTPECDSFDNVEMTEDGSGRIIPLRCTDDRTSTEDLEVSVSSADESLVIADLSEGQVRLRLVAEASGQTTVEVRVSDRLGQAQRNTWIQQFIVTVAEVNDVPFFETLPAEVLVSLPDAAYLELQFGDVDDDSSALEVTMDYSWASWDGTRLKLQPVMAGEWQLTITVSDTENSVSRIIGVIAMALPDILVESVEGDGGIEQVSAGDVVEVIGWVRNSGQADAHFISIRCLADGQLFDVTIIDIVSPGQLRRAVCDWQVPNNDDVVLLSVVIDHALEIRESDEENNDGSTIITVVQPQPSSSISDERSSEISNVVKVGVTATVIMAIVAAFFLFAPKGVRKMK